MEGTEREQKLKELLQHADNLKVKIIQMVSHSQNVIWMLETNRMPEGQSAMEFIKQIENKGWNFVQSQEETPVVEEMDFRIDIDTVTALVKQLRETQDEHYRLMKEAARSISAQTAKETSFSQEA